MKFVDIYDAKVDIIPYIERVNKHHETIVICQNGVPVCQLSAYATVGKGSASTAKKSEWEAPAVSTDVKEPQGA